jgi:hypothetical protein
MEATLPRDNNQARGSALASKAVLVVLILLAQNPTPAAGGFAQPSASAWPLFL